MGRQSLTYGEEQINYKVCFVPRRTRKVAIHVHPDGVVQVDAPQGAELSEIRQAVRKRARWLVSHLRQISEQRAHVLPRRYISGESHFYLGRRYQLKVIQENTTKPQVKLLRGYLQITSRETNPDTVKALLRKWYREHAKKVFLRRMQALIPQITWLKTGPPPIQLLEMKKQWGSCSPKKRILLNPHLVKAPRECVDYVILHELCHLREHNHSQHYYRLLAALMPEWRSVKGRLDGMAELLLNQ